MTNTGSATVLFDGALPEEKEPERLMRTEQNNKRIKQLRASYDTTICPVPTYLSSTSYAFLAPSLREALAASPYASRTRIVPGEADDSCALYAKNLPKSIIFTSDTDLLLFDYHAETLVVLFQDAASPTGLKAHAPHQIAEKLKLKRLVPLAYAIQQRSSEGMDDLVRDARNLASDSPLYMEFSRRYTADVITPMYLERHPDLQLSLQELDVRVSEVVHEAMLGSNGLPVYLPLLVEDPNQASAWNMGQDLRTLAYSLVAPTSSKVREYRRKAQGISPQDISPFSATDMDAPAKEWEERVGAVLKWGEAKNISRPLLWSLLALSLVVGELNTPPSLALISRVLNGDFDNTWGFVQLAARMQAALYSLRMLKQVTAIWLKVNQQDQSNLHQILSNLQTSMSDFPAISNLFIVPGQEKRLLADHEQLKELVEEIFSSVGIEVASEPISNKKKKKQAKEADRKRRKIEQRLAQQ
jgi:hypothetical protein